MWSKEPFHSSWKLQQYSAQSSSNIALVNKVTFEGDSCIIRSSWVELEQPSVKNTEINLSVMKAICFKILWVNIYGNTELEKWSGSNTCCDVLIFPSPCLQPFSFLFGLNEFFSENCFMVSFSCYRQLPDVKE